MGLCHRVPGTELLGLLGPVQTRLSTKAGKHTLAAMTMDDDDALGTQPTSASDDVRKHRLPSDRVHHLRQIGNHPLALPGREDHYGQTHRFSTLA